MARKLKTFVTSMGFYDLAVAAPSQKAALEAFGIKRNLFHEGSALETNEPSIVEAAMEAPGKVLRRAVGSDAPYSEHGEPPKSLPARKRSSRPMKPERRGNSSKAAEDARNGKSAHVIDFEKERARRRQTEARDAKREAARDRSVAHAQAALAKARAKHEKNLSKLDIERQNINERASEENDRWRKERDKLQAALERARD